MSQKVTRKGVPNEDKEKRQTDSPIKEMKKKVAANAEKEKQATATEKSTEKPSEKTDKNKTSEKPAEKQDKKSPEKPAEKPEKNAAKPAENNEKNVEKKADKAEKKDAEKPKEDSSKGEKSSKTEKSEPKKAESTRGKVNGDTHNGVSDGVTDDALNGTVSADSDDELLVIDDHQDDQDELFPELTYDDTSDVECFEPPTPENAPSRSFTRRSQAKTTRTPETPRPASGRQPDAAADESKDSKVLKLKDDSLATDRKLRSSDSPKPDSKKPQETPKKPDSQKDKDEKTQENEPKDSSSKDENEKDKEVVEVVIEVEGSEEEQPNTKPDTNYSKSRVKVSPYRRSVRLADQTASSVMANYTGNNTTMEMDITESSFASEDQSLDDSSYLSGLRSIRGRRSYKPLKEMTLRNLIANRSARSATGLSEHPSRPTGTVVGRKRKPDVEEAREAAGEAGEASASEAHGKRMRLLERIAQPFRRTITSTPLPRRAADIVGINTDLPLTAPVATPETFDPESLKTAVPPSVPLSSSPETVSTERDAKRCVVM